MGDSTENGTVAVETNNEEVKTESSAKKKSVTGLYFSDIPKDVRVSEFKNVLREKDVKLVFVRWKSFKQAATVFIEGELEDVMKSLEGLSIQEQPLKFAEIVPNIEGRNSAVQRRQEKKARSFKEGGGRRQEAMEAEKTRKRVNRKEQRIKKREDFEGKFGLFVGKIPRGVSRDDLGHEFAKLKVPVPDYVDWVVKKGHAFAFWRESDPRLSLEAFADIKVGGVTLQVELYDMERVRAREERRRGEEKEREEGRKTQNGAKQSQEADKVKVESQQVKTEIKNAKNKEVKKGSGDAKSEESSAKSKDVNGEKSGKVKTGKAAEKEGVEKSPAKGNEGSKVSSSPSSKTTKAKAANDSPSSKTVKGAANSSSSSSSSPSKSAKSAAPANAVTSTEAGKDQCSIS